jgi:nitrite reductase/ring-hydroxylating ferredoxin subunit
MKLRFIFLFVVLIISCKKNKNLHPVPNQSFDFTIDLTLPSYADLNGVGGYAFVTGGSKGIIVYRRSIDEYIAFDRHSPADVDGSCATALTPNSDNFLVLEDACNNAEFSLYDGSAIANSEFGLRQYMAIWDGGQVLRIFN